MSNSDKPAGYGTRWKSGQSGNPAGRPPGRSLFSGIVRDMMSEPVALVRDDGTTVDISKTEYLLRQTFECAIKGDRISRRYLLTETRRAGELEMRQQATPQEDIVGNDGLTDYQRKMKETSNSLAEKLASFRSKHKMRLDELSAEAGKKQRQDGTPEQASRANGRGPED